MWLKKKYPSNDLNMTHERYVKSGSLGIQGRHGYFSHNLPAISGEKVAREDIVYENLEDDCFATLVS